MSQTVYDFQAQTIRGEAGHDALFGAGGDDWLQGLHGDDTLDGGAGADIMLGGAGDDHYVIRDAADRGIEAEAEGADTAWVFISGWTLPAHVEIGRLIGSANMLTGGDEGVKLVAGSGPSTLIGGAGDDVLWGGATADRLAGGAGLDAMRGGGGADTMLGGPGDDHAVITTGTETFLEDADAGIDTAWVTAQGWTLPAQVEIARLAGTATLISGAGLHQHLVANPLFGSTLLGGAGHDVLWGSEHADLMLGGEGHDMLRGGFGADTMRGGPGNDHVVVNDLSDLAEELPDAGTDTAWVTIDGWVLPENMEVAYLSEGARQLSGSQGADQLVANGALGGVLDGRGGHDTLWGSNLADSLAGGAGDDVLYGFAGADRFIFDLPGWGRDAVADFNSAEGDRIDLRGSGVTALDQFALVTADGNTALRAGAGEIMLFNTTGVTAADFIFS